MSRALDQALLQLASGGMIVLSDNEGRENEGDLVMAAQFVTPSAITFMAKQASGLICLCLTSQKAEKLQLRAMVDHNRANRSTAFTVSIEAAEGITTGISAKDRSHTIRTAAHPSAKAQQIVSPGHVFPLIAKNGGVLERDGHTEASVDLMKMAGLEPAAVICEIMGEDGEMLSGARLLRFAAAHGLPHLTIDELIAYRKSGAAPLAFATPVGTPHLNSI